MEKAVGDLGSCTPVDFLDFDEDEYNTVFEYELDEYEDEDGTRWIGEFESISDICSCYASRY